SRPGPTGCSWTCRTSTRGTFSRSVRSLWSVRCVSVRKLLRPAVSVSLLAWVAWHTDWAQVAAAFGRLRLGWWLAAGGVLVVTQVVSALRWRMLARPLGFDGSLGRYTSYYFIGMFFNLVLPTSVGGDVVRALYLDGRSGRRLAAFT